MRRKLVADRSPHAFWAVPKFLEKPAASAHNFYPDHTRGAVPKWLRERSAKPLCNGSNPFGASTHPVQNQWITAFRIKSPSATWKQLGNHRRSRAFHTQGRDTRASLDSATLDGVGTGKGQLARPTSREWSTGLWRTQRGMKMRGSRRLIVRIGAGIGIAIGVGLGAD